MSASRHNHGRLLDLLLPRPDIVDNGRNRFPLFRASSAPSVPSGARGRALFGRHRRGLQRGQFDRTVPHAGSGWLLTRRGAGGADAPFRRQGRDPLRCDDPGRHAAGVLPLERAVRVDRLRFVGQREQRRLRRHGRHGSAGVAQGRHQRDQRQFPRRSGQRKRDLVEPRGERGMLGEADVRRSPEPAPHHRQRMDRPRRQRLHGLESRAAPSRSTRAGST